MAKYLWQSMTRISERFPFLSMDSRTSLRKGKEVFKIFFLHIYLAICTQPRKRLSTVIKLLLIRFCFICQQTKSLTPPSSVQLIEHSKISSASCCMGSLTMEPVAQQRCTLPIHHPAEEVLGQGKTER